MTLDPTFVSNLILVLTGFGGAFLAALWISLVIWTYRISARARDPLANPGDIAGGCPQFAGALVYLILRPRTLIYQRTLEEEASQARRPPLSGLRTPCQETGRFAQPY
jgi:hypothetical protein